MKKNKIVKKIGKRNRINLDLPDHLNRTRIKSITYTKSGIINDLECPNCDGDGHFLEDNTHARGGTMNPYLCSYCDGKGKINEDMVKEITFDHEGEPVIVFKEGDESYDSNRK